MNKIKTDSPMRKIRFFRLHRHNKTGGYYIPTGTRTEEISGIELVDYFNVMTGKPYSRPAKEWYERKLYPKSHGFKPRYSLIKKIGNHGVSYGNPVECFQP